MVVDIKSRDFYEFYASIYFKEYLDGKRKRAIVNRNSRYYITYQKYCEVISDLNIGLRNLIVEKSFDFNIPYRLGNLSIKKSKLEPFINNEGELVNILPIDWKATKDLWSIDEDAKTKKTLVRHLNKHSQGYVMRWKYNVLKANYMFKTVYRFIPCRTAKRMITSVVKDENNKVDYYLL